ncbi:MAG: DNA polymerase III subunit delta [Gemmatimonadales bacterium]
MSSVRPDQLRRQLAKAPPSGSYYVHGSQPVLRDEAVAMLLDAALDPATRDFNLDYISAQQIDPDALEAACATLPMMAERRVVVLRDVEAWKRKTKAKQPAVAYLARPAPETVLVLVQGTDDIPDADLATRCTLVDCGDLAGPALDAWLDARLDKADVTLAPDAREHLLRATGGDLGLLTAESEKLSGLGGGEMLSLEAVSALVGVRHGETVDDWRDAVLRDDVPAALAALPRVLDQTGVSGVKLVTTLGASLLVLRWARATALDRRLRGRPLADAVKKLCFERRPAVGSYDPFARLISEIVGRWPDTRVGKAIAATLLADIALKNTTVSDNGGIVTDLVLTLAATRQKKAA